MWAMSAYTAMLTRTPQFIDFEPGVSNSFSQGGPHQPQGYLQRVKCKFNYLTVKEWLHLYSPKIISALWKQPRGWCGPQWKWVWHPCFRETERNGERRGKRTCCSTYLCIHWVILVGALTEKQTCNLGILGWHSNQLSYPVMAWNNFLLSYSVL